VSFQHETSQPPHICVAHICKQSSCQKVSFWLVVFSDQSGAEGQFFWKRRSENSNFAIETKASGTGREAVWQLLPCSLNPLSRRRLLLAVPNNHRRRFGPVACLVWE
jgi:hypothetical protein